MAIINLAKQHTKLKINIVISKEIKMYCNSKHAYLDTYTVGTYPR